MRKSSIGTVKVIRKIYNWAQLWLYNKTLIHHTYSIILRPSTTKDKAQENK